VNGQQVPVELGDTYAVQCTVMGGNPPPVVTLSSGLMPSVPFHHVQVSDLFVYLFVGHCWLGGRKGIKPVKTLGGGVVICLEQGADLRIAQLMPLPLTVICFSKIKIGFTFLVPAHPCIPGKRAFKWLCVCVCVLFVGTNMTSVLGSRAVSVLDAGEEGPGFESQPQHCRVTVLGKLFTPIVPLFTKQRNW